MIVEGLRLATAGRMKTIEAEASVRSAALAFADHRIGLLVVCGEDGRAAGVISKSDLVRHLASGGAGQTPVRPVMSRPVVSCAPTDDLHSTWQTMTARGLQNMPVLGKDGKPLGILDVRDALAALLDEEQYQERLLADYISGVGYR
jgi:CBS domain-containing protein